MFGPLNGVRTALVVGAAICSVVALIVGRPIVAIVLSIGIAAHGGLWWWLYRHRNDATDDGAPHGSNGGQLEGTDS